MGVKLGSWQWGRNAGWGCLRIGYRGEYLGLRGMRQEGSGENYIMRNWMICISHPILCEWYKQEERDGRGMWRVWWRGEACTGFWWGNLTEGDHLGDPGADGRIILRWIFRKWDVGVWTESSWLRKATGGGNLWMREWTFWFHKMRGISRLAENRLASQEGLCSIA